MSPAQNGARASQASADTSRPTVCIVTLDPEFIDVLTSELLPWVNVVVRSSYDDLARWTREKKVSAVMLDIDTQGEDPYGGLPVLTELRRLNQDFTLISVSRGRARSGRSWRFEWWRQTPSSVQPPGTAGVSASVSG